MPYNLGWMEYYENRKEKKNVNKGKEKGKGNGKEKKKSSKDIFTKNIIYKEVLTQKNVISLIHTYFFPRCQQYFSFKYLTNNLYAGHFQHTLKNCK
jgi:hypothetical protein